MTLPTGTVRRLPRSSTYGLSQLWTADARGDERMGLIRVPEELCHSLPFTEKRRHFNAIITAHLKQWDEWLAKQGWRMNSKPRVEGPFDPPAKDGKSAPLDAGMKHYHAFALFKRDYPLVLPTDAALWFREEAKKYGEQGMAPAAVDSHESRTVKTILNPERVDPMKFAAERRERLGITRDDWTQQPLDPSKDANQIV